MRSLLGLFCSLGLALPGCSGDGGGGSTDTESGTGTDSTTGTGSTSGSTAPTSSSDSASASASGSSTTTDSGSTSDSDSTSDSNSTSTGTAGDTSTTGAGTTGGGPSNADCEQFCTDYWDACVDSDGNDYGNPGGCMNACKDWDDDQYECRVMHLGLVESPDDGHCSHAGLSGNGMCT